MPSAIVTKHRTGEECKTFCISNKQLNYYPTLANGLSMRISPQTRSVIRQTAAELFGEEARIVLFGSRTDDDQRGGDIDLLIDLPNIDDEKQRKSLTFVARLQRRLGDQRIDVLVADPSTPELPIYRVARETGIAL